MADLEVQYLQVQTTTDSRAEAMELSRAAVESRLAACAQVAGPVASVYWWEDGLERAEEWLVALPIVAGSAAYLNWMREETRPAQGALGRQGA